METFEYEIENYCVTQHAIVPQSFKMPTKYFYSMQNSREIWGE
jgi:hypothetical protein